MNWTQLILAGVSVIGGLVMVVLSLYMPPEGQIDPTALVAYGEALTFAGAVLGIDYHYKNKQNS